MENDNPVNSHMENVFYAALALHVAGKPINKENIRVVLRAAGTPVDENGLDIIAAFMQSLQAANLKNDSMNDPRIIQILSKALSQQKIQVEQLEALLKELGEHGPSSRQNVTNSTDQTSGDILVVSDSSSSHQVAGSEGCYVYGIADGRKDINLGRIGIEGGEVYTISYQDICAIVQRCAAQPFQSQDAEKVKKWVLAHQNVLDTAKAQFDVIIPLSFDTILKPCEDGISSDQMVRDWLKNDYAHFHSLISRIEGKDEYAIQISYIPSEIGKHLPEPGPEVVKIQNEIAKNTPGIAYIYKQKLEKALKAEMEKMANGWFKDFFSRISQHVDDTVIERNRKLENDMVMLLSLSCLVSKEKVDSLGEELEKINNMDGFSVHFSGPWPPYSFVSKPIEVGAKKGTIGTH